MNIPKKNSFNNRFKKIYNQLKIFNLDAFILTYMPHIRFASGFSGTTAICLITEINKYLLTDRRYSEQASNEAIGWKIITSNNNIIDELVNQKLVKNGWRIGVDGNHIVLSNYKNLVKLFPKNRILPKVGFIDTIAEVKDSYEIEQIQQAAKITDKVYKKILNMIKPGISELDIAAEITYFHRMYGADGDAFRPIVASGIRGAMPHADSTQKKIRHGEMITLDFGCVVNGYHSDMTRTISVGKPKKEALKIYDIVLTAQIKAIEVAKEGITYKALDAVARDHINSAGYGKYFTHSLGHGIGLQIHEPPRLSAYRTGKLKSGNVVTIEPGIYIQEFGGVRIEDDVVIHKNSNKVLNSSTKELIIL